MLNERGLTLMEILIAALIGVVAAGGMMVATTMSQKTSAGAVGVVEAADFAQQTIERFRNKIACDDIDWFNAPDCTAAGLPAGWTADDLPPATDTLSMLAQGGTRQYQIAEFDCDEDGQVGDCYKVESKVSWTPRQ